ncbi:CPBP family intramembrane metalloprotease, partial [Rhodococcus hoagii]|nr:CPBP family intramembrane metalloprotease [Prescottella equi]
MRRAAALGFGTALVAWNNGVLPALRLSSRHRAIAGTVVA